MIPRKVPLDTCADFMVRTLKGKGVAGRDAQRIAWHIVRAEAFRPHSHGLAQLWALDKFLGEEIDPSVIPRTTHETPASLAIDCRGGIGQRAMLQAVEQGREKAAQSGSVWVTVGAMGWVGALGPYFIDALKAGMLVCAWAHSMRRTACAPVGGRMPFFSTNPLVVGFGAHPLPVLADFSSSTLSNAGFRSLANAGTRTTNPRFLDREGNFSDDPQVCFREGTLLFAGGRDEEHKGYALSLFATACAALAGTDVDSRTCPAAEQSVAFLLIDPAKSGSDAYRERISSFIRQLKKCPPRADAKEIRLPGERGFRSLEKARREGLELSDDKRELLESIARANGIAFGE
jgi:LDH2 family malate/lactate/ureidoglycolate dehydrogenase